MIDTTKLRELAQAATPGPWEYRALEWGNYVTADGQTSVCQGALSRTESMQFIAAANPATVLQLLDELERTQGSVATVSAALSAAERELQRLRPIESAARNLAKVKGRHHSEQAMNQLLEALK